MANAKEIFNNKFVASKLTGSTKFFNNLDEVKEFNSLQEKYISNVNYAVPSNFARFGSAEEYYKNAYSYISYNYPYDGSTQEKLNWTNSLNELEYYIYNKQITKYRGYANLSSSQYIKINSHIQETLEEVENSYYDTKEIYNSTKKKLLHNDINFDNGITLEAWLNFEDEAANSTIFQIQAITSSLTTVNLLTINRDITGTPHFSVIDNTAPNTYNFTTEIKKQEWHHYAISIFSDRMSLYVDGELTEEIKNINLSASNDTYIFGPYGLMYSSYADTLPSVISYTEQYVFKVGGGQKFSIDELRFWGKERNLEKIGRYWFTQIDGNDFSDYANSNLLFYYKFNEGWDQQYLQICLDYSGRKNDGEIINYSSTCRTSGSAIDLSGRVQDQEKYDIIYKGLDLSSNLVSNYNIFLSGAIEHDLSNTNMLYHKFPAWILEEEEENGTQNLKQIIQIISSYFDDLYNKINEITNYKQINYTTDKSNIYPFYDKILTSMGFDVTDLFSNLSIIEKISSRNDTTLFDGDIKKIKNGIFQNIYNNLSYIYKSKGTSKSLKSFLRSYGIDENLLRINLYADKSLYDVKDRSIETVVKKKTVTMTSHNVVYLNSLVSFEETGDNNYYTLEAAAIFPKKLKINAPQTASLIGIHNSIAAYDLYPTSANYQFYSYIENDQLLGSRFVVTDGTNISSSLYYKDLYDDTVWNVCFRKRPTVDIVSGSNSLSYKMEFYAVNKNSPIQKEFSCAFPLNTANGHIRYYIGARNIPYNTNNNIYEANSKFLYCNFWTDYLNNNIIVSHNMDILNYGVDE